MQDLRHFGKFKTYNKKKETDLNADRKRGSGHSG
jgi:hypothetical protein